VRIAVQLRPWLIQEPTPTLDAVLDEASQAGYEGIEIGAHYLDWDHPKDFRALLDRHSLAISGVHVGGDIFNRPNVERVRANLKRVAACVTAIGAPFLLYSGLLIENKTTEERASELDSILAAAEICAQHGLRLLYHNHWWEIARDFADLRFYQQHSDPELVSFCLDLGWVHRASGDPLKAALELGSRAPYFHLRDDTPQQVWKGLGQGAIDFPPLLRKLEELRPAWVVIEQDDISGSILDAVSSSRRYLHKTMNW